MTRLAGHAPLPSAAEERCRMCGGQAVHKVEQVMDGIPRYPFTAYLCCEHFGAVMGPFAEAWCGRA